MGPVAGGVVQSALLAGGSLLGGISANRARRREARKNRQFQERMRNTEWQAAVADMEAAGINPAVAYSQGGAATPSGNMAAQEDVVTPAVSTGLQARQMKKQLGLLDAQTEATKAQRDATYYTGLKAQREARFQEILNMLWGDWRGREFNPGPLWRQHEAQSGLAVERARGAQLDNVLLKNLADVAESDVGRQSAWIRYLLQALKGR